MLQTIEHIPTPFECKFCCYNCVPKKVSQPIERAELMKKREAEKEKKRAEKKSKSKKPRIRRDGSPSRRIL